MTNVRRDTADTHDVRVDELLVVRCQLGERAAFEDLIDRWHGPLRGYVRRVAGGDEAADEALQEVWLRVFRGIHRLRDGAKLRSWLFGIAHHVAMDGWRRQYAAPLEADMHPVEIAADEPDDLEEELEAMHRELARLPFVEREVITLFYLRELSMAQIAEALQVPVGTVKSRLFRARRLLRAELESSERLGGAR